MSDYRYRSHDEDPVELDDSRYLDAILHPDDAAEVKRRLDGPCSGYTPRMHWPDAEPLVFRVDAVCPHKKDRPMPPAVRIAGGAIMAAILSGACWWSRCGGGGCELAAAEWKDILSGGSNMGRQSTNEGP